MALGLELKLRMGQQLVMTPQLQMAIKLLQMSSLELADYLQEELDKNPLLEREEDRPDEDVVGMSEMLANERASEGSNSPSNEDEPSERNLSEDLPVDASWSDIYGDGSGSFSAPQNFDNTSSSEAPPLENTLVRNETLTDYLLWQLGVSALNEKERLIGTAIIDAIDDNGYLSADLQSIAEMTGTTVEEVEDALVLVQSFEPAGVAARTLAESLLLQLKSRKQAHPPFTTLLENLEDLARRDFRKLKRILKITDEELQEAVELIQSLNPKPGLAFGSEQTNYIAPDVYVRKQDGQWVVEVNTDAMPKLRINREYDNALNGRLSAQDKRFLQDNARSAQWLIKSLEQRSSTIYRVAESIVRFQSNFLEYGREHLKPLILKDVADDIGVHESTASRVTSNKYIHTPRGIFELKYFFSSSLVSQSGENHSSEAVKFKIQKLVESESPSRPYSDEKLAKLLKDQGIIVARRTIAKYRDILNIPSSSRRKQLGSGSSES
ncbi:RNA polymerase factor sigma-54 [Candidatus Magnetaquicoccus inordinatus]|uniref:RNA polymerase factor sigma-54 n=1 Tax=Candidatus Magnetaquicoccus inordinatus TaxID=2496818 RepID=UPI00102C8654|nr:RNA polymerase factor sigma-54 [Candidatus Magnetaquicoccus inordinatus]